MRNLNFDITTSSKATGPTTACRRLGRFILTAALALFGGMGSGAAQVPGERADDTQTVMMAGERDSATLFDSSATLDDYLAIAQRRNPGLRSAYNLWTADLKKSEYAGALPDPMFSYAYFIESVETRVGPQEQRFSIRQSFPWFGTLGAQEDVALAMSQVSYRKFEAARLRLYFRVKAAYYDYYYLGQNLRVTVENFDLLKFWESVAQAKYRVGLKKHPDIIKAQVELGLLEDRLHTLQEQQAPAAARLRALLGVADSVRLPLPATIYVDEAPLIGDSVVNVIVQNNPDLQALQHVVERADAGERLAGKQALPDFSIGVDYIQTGDALNPTMAESGKDPWMISGSVSLPIWFGKNGARKDEARARRRAAEYDRLDSENQLTAIAARVLFEYSDALRKIRLYRDGLVPKAQQSLQAMYAAYQAGETDFLNVLDAQRQLLDFQLTVAREQVTLATKRAQLEMLSGTDLGIYLQR